MDVLFEYADIKPYRVHMEQTDEEWNGDVFRDVDVILCVGNARDIYGGMLHKYKEARPDGIIVALNLEQPSFLGPEDYIVQGDVQEVLPQLALLIN